MRFKEVSGFIKQVYSAEYCSKKCVKLKSLRISNCET